jgi:hypothetical protein
VEVLEFGRATFIAAGVTKVDMMRKKSNKKNIISFKEAVYTSADRVFLRSIFIELKLIIRFRA